MWTFLQKQLRNAALCSFTPSVSGPWSRPLTCFHVVLQLIQSRRPVLPPSLSSVRARGLQLLSCVLSVGGAQLSVSSPPDSTDRATTHRLTSIFCPSNRTKVHVSSSGVIVSVLLSAAADQETLKQDPSQLFVQIGLNLFRSLTDYYIYLTPPGVKIIIMNQSDLSFLFIFFYCCSLYKWALCRWAFDDLPFRFNWCNSGERVIISRLLLINSVLSSLSQRFLSFLLFFYHLLLCSVFLTSH